MINFASLIHRKYKRGCLDVLSSAIKLNLPCKDMIYVLYCYAKSFKSPFLDICEYAEHIKHKKFGDLMEELLVAKDVILKNMDKDTQKLESKLSEWNQDIQK
ncbi:MAG: hypothetical protein ACOCWI_03555 [Bacillota bacterium]